MGDRAGRWFHTLVVVGTAMTACGGSTDVETRPSPAPDGGRSGAHPVVGGNDGGSDDGAFASSPDGATTKDASVAPDGATYAACCNTSNGQCLYGDAGRPLCAVQCPYFCCMPFNGCIQ